MTVVPLLPGQHAYIVRLACGHVTTLNQFPTFAPQPGDELICFQHAITTTVVSADDTTTEESQDEHV